MNISPCRCTALIQCRRCREIEHHVRKDPASALGVLLAVLREDGAALPLLTVVAHPHAQGPGEFAVAGPEGRPLTWAEASAVCWLPPPARRS